MNFIKLFIGTLRQDFKVSSIKLLKMIKINQATKFRYNLRIGINQSTSRVGRRDVVKIGCYFASLISHS